MTGKWEKVSNTTLEENLKPKQVSNVTKTSSLVE